MSHADYKSTEAANHTRKAMDDLHGFFFAKYFAPILHACKALTV